MVAPSDFHISNAPTQVRVGTRRSRVAAVAGIALIVALAALPAIASRNLIQDMIFVFTC